MSGVVRRGRRHVGQLEFTAEELRNIAYALGMHDVGAQDMFQLADEVDAANGVGVDPWGDDETAAKRGRP